MSFMGVSLTIAWTRAIRSECSGQTSVQLAKTKLSTTTLSEKSDRRTGMPSVNDHGIGTPHFRAKVALTHFC